MRAHTRTHRVASNVHIRERHVDVAEAPHQANRRVEQLRERHSTVMRRMTSDSGQVNHVYILGLLCYLAIAPVRYHGRAENIRIYVRICINSCRQCIIDTRTCGLSEYCRARHTHIAHQHLTFTCRGTYSAHTHSLMRRDECTQGMELPRTGAGPLGVRYCPTGLYTSRPLAHHGFP